jgi:hypothetical protein
MESWKKVWQEALGPILSTDGLEALARALERDDPRLLQGKTTEPPPLQCCADWPVEGADAIGFAYWQGDGLSTVGEVEEAFAQTCFKVDQLLGEPAACRFYVNWYDETPRDEMRAALLPEVQKSLSERQREGEAA